MANVVVKSNSRGVDVPPGLNNFLRVTEEDVRECDMYDPSVLDEIVDFYRQLQAAGNDIIKHLHNRMKLETLPLLLVKPIKGKHARIFINKPEIEEKRDGK
jgi:hypothetical protein